MALILAASAAHLGISALHRMCALTTKQTEKGAPEVRRRQAIGLSSAQRFHCIAAFHAKHVDFLVCLLQIANFSINVLILNFQTLKICIENI